jgi:hypothetical protein
MTIPNVNDWWKYTADEWLAFAYWLHDQLPPSNPNKRTEAWEAIRRVLMLKYGVPCLKPGCEGISFLERDEDGYYWVCSDKACKDERDEPFPETYYAALGNRAALFNRKVFRGAVPEDFDEW